jgi:hypothetical protein
MLVDAKEDVRLSSQMSFQALIPSSHQSYSTATNTLPALPDCATQSRTPETAAKDPGHSAERSIASSGVRLCEKRTSGGAVRAPIR